MSDKKSNDVMRICVLLLALATMSCVGKDEQLAMLRQQFITRSPQSPFNDSVCSAALDSAIQQFDNGKLELYIYVSADSSDTPINILKEKFDARIIQFGEVDAVFRFCYNKTMLESFEKKHEFSLIDSMNAIYDSLDKIGMTSVKPKFGLKWDAFDKYLAENLEFPEGLDLDYPYPFVQVKFRVSPSGKLDSITVYKSFSPVYDSAAVRLFKAMPPWRPARDEDGGYQRAFGIYPIRFDPRMRKTIAK